MPNYGFICNGCKHAFDRLLQIKDRELPLSEACPQCKKKKILKDYGSYTQVLTSDTKLTPDKATGGKWSELMNRMKRGVGKQHHQNLDSATARTGRQWLG
jgi:putative FmdB family regulatory protein